LATRLTEDQIKEEVLRVLPLLEKKSEESRDILYFAFSGFSNREIAHDCRIEAKHVPARVTQLFNTLNLPCRQDSEDARLIIIGALAIIDKDGEKATNTPAPPEPTAPNYDAEILEASARIAELENEDLLLFVKFSDDGELEWADFCGLSMKLGLGELESDAARHALREAYELAGKPVPTAVVEPEEDSVPEAIAEEEEAVIEELALQEEPLPADALQAAAARIPLLGAEEFSVVLYVAAGCTDKEIAEKMQCPVSFVLRALATAGTLLGVPDLGGGGSTRDFIADAYRLHYA